MVSLGPVGRNVAAGMTGGLGYFFDAEGDFTDKVSDADMDSSLCHVSSVEWASLGAEVSIAASPLLTSRSILRSLPSSVSRPPPEPSSLGTSSRCGNGDMVSL